MLIAKLSGAFQKIQLHWPNTALTLNGFQVNRDDITVLLGDIFQAFNVVSSDADKAR